MASFAEYTKKKKKKEQEQSAKGMSFTDYTKQQLGKDDIEEPTYKTYKVSQDDDIAPVKSKTTSTQNFTMSYDDLNYAMNYVPGISNDIRQGIYEKNKNRIAEIDAELANTTAGKEKWWQSTNPIAWIGDKYFGDTKELETERKKLVAANSTFEKYGSAIDLSYDELKTKESEATDNTDKLYYLSLANQKAYEETASKLSEVKMEGEDISILQAMTDLAEMEDGKDKRAREKIVEAQVEKAGYDFNEIYSALTGDANVSGKYLAKYIGNKAWTGLTMFTDGGYATADLILGKPLQAIGWENNPISWLREESADNLETLRFNGNYYAEKMGNTAAQQNWGKFIEGVTGAAPYAVLAYLTKGASLSGSAGLSQTATVATGGTAAKASIALQNMARNPQFWTTFASTYGHDYESAIEMGASEEIAILGATITSLVNSGIEIGLDGQSGIQGLTQQIRNGDTKALYAWLESGGQELAEEIFQGTVDRGTAKVLYDSDVKVLDGEAMLEEGALGGAVGLTLGGGQIGVEKAVNAVADNTYTADEKKVIENEVKKRIAEKEQNGEEVTSKDKSDIKKQVKTALDRGEIDTDTIEEVLGGENYSTYKNAVDNENALKTEFDTLNKMKQGDMTGEQIDRRAELKQQLEELKNNSNTAEMKTKLGDEVFSLVKDSRLAESYNQRAKRGQAFTADLSQYDTKYHDTIKKAVDSGILNDTRRTHEFVDLIAKVSADKGVLFDFTNNEKIANSRFAVEGKIVNGYVDGDTIGLNIDSPKALNKTVGHEVTHILEGTDFYDVLQSTITEYAKSKGDYDGRLETLTKLYEGVEGTDVNKELTADLVGDYLFTDTEFIHKLSTQNRNLFEKIYDEIKYLCKVATAGSKEARELQRVKKAFEDAYRNGGTNNTENSDVKRSISETTDGRIVAVVDSDILSNIDTTSWNKAKKETAQKAVTNALKQFSEGIVVDGITRKVNRTSRREYTRSNDTEKLYKNSPDVFADKMRAADIADDIVVATTNWSRDGGLTHTRDDNFVDFEHGTTLILSGNAKYSAEVVVGITKNGDAVFYDVVDMTPTTFDIKLAETSTTATTQNAIGDINEISAMETLPQNSKDVKTQYSLSADSEGTELSKGQQEYFKDSKMRDDNVADHKQKQLDIVLETNPMWDDYHQGIRTIDDIRTWAEVLELNDENEGQFVWGDFSRADAEQAMKDGTITVYSSYPIKNGVFVSTSYIQAQEYAGGKNGKVYSKTIPLTDVAWINGDEGQYAEVIDGYSLSEDNQGNKLSPAVQKRFANSKVVDENGDLKVVYHGTYAGEFTIFDKSKGSVEGDFGSGFYFTDNEADVTENYEGGGPDFDNKVAWLAEQIEQDEDIDYDEAKERAKKELYKGSHKFEVYLNMENPARVGETTLLNQETYFDEYNEEDYEDYDDYIGDVEQLVADDINNVVWDIERNIGIDGSEVAGVLWDAYAEGGIDIGLLKDRINELYLEDKNGNLVGNEIVRQIIESLGYDGIIDSTVSTKFKNMYLDADTTHYIVFKPNQIKSVTNQNPTDNLDINLSLSKQGEVTKKQPNLTYGEDVKLDIAPTKEDISAMENTAVVEDYSPAIYDAPITEEQANAMASESLESLTDADAPIEVEDGYYNIPDTSSLDKKTLKNIGKSLRDTLSLTPQETKAIQEIVQEYSTSELPSSEELFDTIKEKFAEKHWREKSNEVADVKRWLRNEKINVSQKIKQGIDDYSSFRKSHSGKIAFSKEGIPVDSAYQELNELYPDFFPADIVNEADQLLRMGEVADMDIYTENSYTLDDDTIQEAVNIVTNEVRGYKDNLAQAAAEETARADLHSVAPPKAEQITDGTRGDALLNQSLDNYPMQTVKERETEKLRAVEAELADNKQLRREAQADYNAEIARLSKEYAALKDKNTKKANNIVQRVTRLERLKATVDADYAKRISDLEARVEKMNSATYQTAVQRKSKMQEYTEQMQNLVGDTSTWKDKKIGLQYEVNTLHRNLRDVVRDENGNRDIAKADAIYEELQGKYNEHEAELKRESARIKKVFADMKITNAESAYIQMLGELRSNPQTTLTEDDVKEYYEKHKNKIDTAKVDKAINLAHQTFDSLLERVNATLREQGMKEIPHRQGYFPHFVEPKQNFVQKLLNWKTQNNEIPTDIAGLTEEFNPEKSWQSFNKERHGDTTDYNFTKGLDNYVQGALDWIYHIEDIQKRRAFENHIRYVHSEKGVQERIDAIRNNEEYDADQAQEQIDLVLNEAKNPLNNFVVDFRTGTNVLAGKKNSLDRVTEQQTGRGIYSAMTNIQNRLSANMVMANVRSALTNFIPITQSWAQVSPMRSLQATKDTIANAIKDDGIIDKSTFLTNRLKEPDNLYQTNWDKVLDKAGIMFEVVDNFSSQVIWRSKYNQNIANGMSESQAIKNADQFAENVMAGRSRGNEPTLFTAKSPLAKAFTMFQLEVNNQYGYLFKDVPQDLKAETNHWKLNYAKGLTTAFIGAYVYNELMKQVSGSGAALDPIGIIKDLLRDLGLFDDDEEKEPKEVVTNLADNVIEELPFVGGLFGGGRIPISSALPYSDDGLTGAIEDITEGDWKSVGKEMLTPILNVGLPVAGGQIKKTMQGLSMFNTDEDHPIAGSYTDSGALRFPVDDTLGNRIQAGIFGQWANENARDYIENGRKPLNEKQIQEYSDVDLPIADYWDYREGLKGLKTLEEKAEYINSLDIEDWQKNLLINNIADRKEDIDMTDYDNYSSWDEFDWAEKNPEKYDFFTSNGISYEDYANADEDGKAAYTWAYNNPEKYTLSKAVTDDVVTYRQYTGDLYDIKADKDANGDTITGSGKEKKLDYINSLDELDYGQKCILFRSLYSSKEDKANYNPVIIDYLNEREDISYEEMVTILEELDMTVDEDGYIYWD